MRFWTIACCFTVAVFALALTPEQAHAWTPGTHIFLGENVLANLAALPPAVAAVLRAHPHDFLYGNIAADTSMAKKYAPVGRHCHAWHVGQEILDGADSDHLKAFGLGYLSHLAADTVAHNFFVPHQLVVTSRTIALGHSWWESRFETHLGDQYARTAMEIIRLDHAESDDHLDSIISPTIFSVRTNRRLFRGMVGITETLSWQKAFKKIAQKSKWDLNDEALDRHMGTCFHFIMENLSRSEGGARKLDPSGDSSLALAKKIRMAVLKNNMRSDLDYLTEVAAENFSLPERELEYWKDSGSHRPWSSTPVPPERTG
jgi:Zinc dependent phospholipase C